MDREYFEEFAHVNNIALSDMADKVIAAINKKNGNCPCRVEEVQCPCPMHREEIEEKGRCTCNLFVRKEE